MKPEGQGFKVVLLSGGYCIRFLSFVSLSLFSSEFFSCFRIFLTFEFGMNVWPSILNVINAGITPRVIKVTPACAIMISTYEYCKSFFRSYNEAESKPS